MAKAVAAARAGLGATYPNPCVGAVIVRRGTVIASARSDVTGGPHAEVRALRKAGPKAKGATMYVTLEPCAHQGRTGPCADAIAAAGVARVVIGIRDPQRRVRGRGVKKLQAAGIEVVEGVLEAECLQVHEHYLHHVRTGLPFVTLKTAASLDGRIAVRTGDSTWITGEPARKVGHRLRAQHHAIAVGVGTVLADDPQLSVRLVRGVDPIRVVFDTRLRVANKSLQLFGPGTIVFHGHKAPAKARRVLEGLGVELIALPGRPAVDDVLRALGERSIRSLLVEGGGQLVGSFVEAGAWDRWHWFMAPRVLGEGTSAVAGVSFDAVAEAPEIRVQSTRKVGLDTLITLEP